MISPVPQIVRPITVVLLWGGATLSQLNLRFHRHELEILTPYDMLLMHIM